MLTLKNSKFPPSVRKVVSDDRTVKYGMFGLVSELMEMGIVETDIPEPDKIWMYIPLDGKHPRTALTREGIIEIVKCYKEDREVL